jgi:hypothetical protein
LQVILIISCQQRRGNEMKITYWCLLVVLSPVTALGTTISAYSHMEEHIQVLVKTDGQSAGAGGAAA